MNLLPIPSEFLSTQMDKFAPHHTLPDFNSPASLSASAAHEPEIMMNFSNYIMHNYTKLGIDVLTKKGGNDGSLSS